MAVSLIFCTKQDTQRLKLKSFFVTLLLTNIKLWRTKMLFYYLVLQSRVKLEHLPGETYIR